MNLIYPEVKQVFHNLKTIKKKQKPKVKQLLTNKGCLTQKAVKEYNKRMSLKR